MMNKPKLLARFKEAGLSLYEAKCYLALLEKDTLTVPEISRIAGIPRTNTYDALEKLLTRGMCISRPGKQKKFSAAEPEMVKDLLLRMVEEQAEEELAAVKLREEAVRQKTEKDRKNISALTRELNPHYRNSLNNTDPLQYIEIIKEPHLIHRRYMQLVGQAENELLVFSKPPYSGPRKKLEEQGDKVAEKLNRKLKVRSIYEIPTDAETRAWLYGEIERAAKQGEKVKVSEGLPMKMAIIDARVVIYSLEDPVSKKISLTTQIVEHRALAESLRILFETLWIQARDFSSLKHSG